MKVLELSRLIDILLLSSPLHIDDVHLAGRVPGGLLDVLLHHGAGEEVRSVLRQDEVGCPGKDVICWRLFSWLLQWLSVEDEGYVTSCKRLSMLAFESGVYS